MDKSAEFITERVTGKVKPGSIVLFHNAAKNTPAALPAVLEKLQSDGYEFLPVSELIYWDNYEILHDGTQAPKTQAAGCGNCGMQGCEPGKKCECAECVLGSEKTAPPQLRGS